MDMQIDKCAGEYVLHLIHPNQYPLSGKLWDNHPQTPSYYTVVTVLGDS